MRGLLYFNFLAGNSSSTTQPTTQPTTPDGNGNNSPYSGSTDGSASQIVLIVLLVSFTFNANSFQKIDRFTLKVNLNYSHKTV